MALHLHSSHHVKICDVLNQRFLGFEFPWVCRLSSHVLLHFGRHIAAPCQMSHTSCPSARSYNHPPLFGCHALPQCTCSQVLRASKMLHHNYHTFSSKLLASAVPALASICDTTHLSRRTMRLCCALLSQTLVQHPELSDGNCHPAPACSSTRSDQVFVHALSVSL